MTIRVATPEDFDQVFQLAMTFANHSPYSQFTKDYVIEGMVKSMLDKPITEAIVLIGDGGLLVGHSTPFIYGDCKSAAELCWWVDEDKRKTGLGKELIEAFEYWAKQNGCKLITMVSLDESIDKYYEKRGYQLQERVYMKEI